MPFFGMIPVVTLFVKGKGAVYTVMYNVIWHILLKSCFSSSLLFIAFTAILFGLKSYIAATTKNAISISRVYC